MEIDKIYCNDCLDLMNSVEDNYIDLTVTSPPYDNLRLYKGYTFDFESIAKELYRITKQGGVVVWVVGDQTVNGSESGTSFRQALYFKEVGFNLHDTMIYMKLSYPPLNNNRYEQQFEYMFVLSNGKPNTFNPITEYCVTAGTKRDRRINKCQEQSIKARPETTIVKDTRIKGCVWGYHVGRNDQTDHPAVFPEALARDHILSWSNEGDLVFDPMCGSGTTCKMAVLNKRHYLGCDVSSEYVAIASKRVSDAIYARDSQPTLF
jgi:DNA modification methylase